MGVFEKDWLAVAAVLRLGPGQNIVIGFFGGRALSCLAYSSSCTPASFPSFQHDNIRFRCLL